MREELWVFVPLCTLAQASLSAPAASAGAGLIVVCPISNDLACTAGRGACAPVVICNSLKFSSRFFAFPAPAPVHPSPPQHTLHAQAGVQQPDAIACLRNALIGRS